MAFYFVITKLTLNQSAIIHTSFKAHAASSLGVCSLFTYKRKTRGFKGIDLFEDRC